MFIAKNYIANNEKVGVQRLVKILVDRLKTIQSSNSDSSKCPLDFYIKYMTDNSTILKELANIIKDNKIPVLLCDDDNAQDRAIKMLTDQVMTLKETFIEYKTMEKQFKKGSTIVRTSDYDIRVPVGYKTKVLKNNQYIDAVGNSRPICFDYWKLLKPKQKSCSKVIKNVNKLITHIEVELACPVTSDNLSYDRGYDDALNDIKAKIKHVLKLKK
jgi:hypothetical protein